jgi:hypothetical protein
MMPAARSAVTEIEFFGKKYEVVKDCHLGYLMPGCPCCRPDAYVNKNGVTIGYIKLPFSSNSCCGFMKVDCFKGRDAEYSKRLYSFISTQGHCHIQSGKMCGCCNEMARFMEFKIKD